MIRSVTKRQRVSDIYLVPEVTAEEPQRQKTGKYRGWRWSISVVHGASVFHVLWRITGIAERSQERECEESCVPPTLDLHDRKKTHRQSTNSNYQIEKLPMPPLIRQVGILLIINFNPPTYSAYMCSGQSVLYYIYIGRWWCIYSPVNSTVQQTNR